MQIFEILKAVLFGIVEGVTEWLPISSTGHLLLLNEIMPLSVSREFYEMLSVVVQLGAILAVVVTYRKKLFSLGRNERQGTLRIWWLTLLGVLPSALAGFLLDDWLDANLYNYITVAVMLVAYGIAFIMVEIAKSKRSASSDKTRELTPKRALLIGLFQTLALVPGTSRSGATILGGYICGLTRTDAAEFSFFLAIPTMAGAGALKIGKFVLEGSTLTAEETIILTVSTLTAFLVSFAVIRLLTDFVSKHSFSGFGVYRIILGAAVILYYLFR